MGKLTSLEISKIFRIPATIVRRLGSQFMPYPDPSSLIASGVAKEYNINEVFTIFVIHHCITTLGYTTEHARRIMELTFVKIHLMPEAMFNIKIAPADNQLIYILRDGSNFSAMSTIPQDYRGIEDIRVIPISNLLRKFKKLMIDG